MKPWPMSVGEVRRSAMLRLIPAARAVGSSQLQERGMPASRPPLDLNAALREMVECVVEERLPEIVEKVVERALLERRRHAGGALARRRVGMAIHLREKSVFRDAGAGRDRAPREGKATTEIAVLIAAIRNAADWQATPLSRAITQLNRWRKAR
jgi:hypothetical protein